MINNVIENDLIYLYILSSILIIVNNLFLDEEFFSKF